MNTSSIFEYRKLEPLDLATYYEIRFSVTENLIHSHQIKYLQKDWALNDIRQGGGWLCLDNGVAIGLCLPLFTPEPILAALFVRPEYHGKGIGKALLNLALDWLQLNGALHVSLETDPGSRAEGFYQHLNWKHEETMGAGCQIKFTLDLQSRKQPA